MLSRHGRKTEERCRESLRSLETLRRERDEIAADYLIMLAEKTGSSPQFEGALLLFSSASGQSRGTIGGGLIEHRAKLLAQALGGSGLAAEILYRLSNKKASDLGMSCGGLNRVYLLPMSLAEPLFEIPELPDFGAADDGAAERFYLTKVLRYFDRTAARKGLTGTDAVTDARLSGEFGVDAQELFLYREGPRFISGEEFCRRYEKELAPRAREDVLHVSPMQDKEEKPCPSEVLFSLKRSANIEVGGEKIFVYRAEEDPRVLIAGGGHVSRALSRVLGMLGWTHVILEDREEMLDPSAFSEFAILRHSSPEVWPEDLTPGPSDFICIMTRGHRHDYTVLKTVLGSAAGYIGVIGSRNKLSGVRRQLTQDGYSAETIQKLFTPIGLDIGAIDLPEIAISIAAELIAVRRKKEGENLGGSLRETVGRYLPL